MLLDGSGGSEADGPWLQRRRGSLIVQDRTPIIDASQC